MREPAVVLCSGMANPLFYGNIVPLGTAAHRDLRMRTPEKPFGFAAEANLVPALLEEFGAAAPHMPIAFLPNADRPAAVFVAGLKPGRNLFIDAAGRWTGGYVPAYLRRYPFIMGDVPSGEPILCIDTGFEGFGTAEGELLFDADGKPGALLGKALALAENYRQSALRSDAFCAALQKLGLFRTVTLDARLPDGESTVVHGLMVVDEEAFNALDADALRELHAQRFLRPIFEHLVSLSAMSQLSSALIAAAPGEKTPDETTVKEARAEPARAKQRH